ncbi:succinylglutamate desuccinylase [Psychrosphaera algicola]|uniref:Succinylglutamate desuccinylase n=1 Tax=Psychrosphaera algicola TaxID=3023714 RepID=A0ABT5F8N5_9GAMM|nr:succinylglutamate desuccinylase [Psychrosphaera sp. G1-22]MDC2887888.1 succinylglutamate desuccinylase [Psychrosphaera sp. G1-22]
MTNIKNNDFLALTRQHENHLPASRFEDNKHSFEIWDTGVLQVSPIGASKFDLAIVLSAGIHGNETAPIEMINELIKEILTKEITLKRPVLFIFGNPPSMNINKRFVIENLNRLFCSTYLNGVDINGDRTNLERQRAEKLEGYVARFYQTYDSENKCHYDLHTAIKDSVHEKFAVYPYIGNSPWKTQQFELLRAMDVTTVMLMQKPATTFSYHSSSVHGADSFTIELGKVRGFGENDKSKFEKAKVTLRNLMCGIDVDKTLFDEANFVMLKVHRSITKNYGDFELGFDDQLANFSEFKEGELLAKENGDDIVAEIDGEAIVFPNAAVEIGQRAILTVVPTSVSKSII